MKKSIIEIFFSNCFQDLIQKLFWVLGFFYLATFLIEAVAPGVIMGVFNINLLLVAVLLCTGLLILFSKSKDNPDHNVGKGALLKVLLVLFGVFFIAVLVVVQYKISIFETAIFTLIAIVISKLLYKLF